MPNLLDIVITQRAPILELFPGKNQALLVGRDAFFVLDLGFDIVDCVAGFDFEGNGFTRESFDETGDLCQLGWELGVSGRGDGFGGGWDGVYICTAGTKMNS